jgi:hypothetical protein
VITTRDRLVHPDRQRRLAHAWRAQPVELDAGHDAPVASPHTFAAAMLAAIDHVEQFSRRATSAL